MESKSGGLIDTLFLYSEECPALLRQALEREEAEGKQQQVHHRPATVDNSDSDGEEEAGVSSSSEDEETEEVSPRTISEAANGTLSASAPAAPPKTKKAPKSTQTEQQRQHTVKKYVENLVCDALPINDAEALHLSTSLLSKPQDSLIAERNYVPQSPAQEYLALSESLANSNVLVILLRSGRFAAGIFKGSKCLVHRACQRYTVRKGQGKAQSTQDGSRRPKSMGAQLRRAGEENLQEDIRTTMIDWKKHIQDTRLVLLSCPKAMKKYLFEAIDPTILSKDDARVRRLPLDIGRPTFENVAIAHQVLMTVQLRQWEPVASSGSVEEKEPTKPLPHDITTTTTPTKEPEIVFPLTPLHEACQKGDLEAISSFLDNPQQAITCLDEHGQETTLTVDQMIKRRVGPDFMTCLHYAAAVSNDENNAVNADTAAACVTQLLLQAKADPALVDARHRPPYFLASHDKVRDAFRLARATLGETYCKWDTVAKVGPPLTEDDMQAKKGREAEKKRKKRARQKQKKAQEKAQAEQDQRQKEEAEESRQKEEAAKRVRDGLQPKTAAAGGTVCDFCQKVVKGRKRKDMFSRLDYVYCSAECVQKHKRELMAAAALSRFGG